MFVCSHVSVQMFACVSANVRMCQCKLRALPALPFLSIDAHNYRVSQEKVAVLAIMASMLKF